MHFYRTPLKTYKSLEWNILTMPTVVWSVRALERVITKGQRCPLWLNQTWAPISIQHSSFMSTSFLDVNSTTDFEQPSTHMRNSWRGLSTTPIRLLNKGLTLITNLWNLFWNYVYSCYWNKLSNKKEPTWNLSSKICK